MGIGGSILLFAIGAVLSFAVGANLEGINLDAVGVILMLLGGIGLLVALVLLNDTGRWGRMERLHEKRPSTIDQERVIYRDEAPVHQERAVYRESRGA